MCWPAAHRERRASSVSEKRDGEVGALSERTEENPSVPGGAAGAHSAHKAWAGPLAPAPALVLRALRARKAPPPPGAHPTAPCYPTPTAPLAVLRRLPGGAGRLGRTPGGRRAAKQKSRALGLWPRALLFQDASRPAAAPPGRYGPHQRQKGDGKARPHDLWGLAHKTLSERGTAPVPLLGQSPGPRSTGPGGTARPAAGYGLRPPAPAGARLSPPAQGRRPRRAAARVGPPSAQGSYRTAHPPLPRGVRSVILINNQYYEMRFTI